MSEHEHGNKDNYPEVRIAQLEREVERQWRVEGLLRRELQQRKQEIACIEEQNDQAANDAHDALRYKLADARETLKKIGRMSRGPWSLEEVEMEASACLERIRD